MFEYRTQGTCSSSITFGIEDGKVHSVSFQGGCHGNLQGIGKLTEGMDAKELIEKLQGIRCGSKPTSCPDQLARAVTAALEQN